MSLSYACRLSKVNPFDYLVVFQGHFRQVFKNHKEWRLWNYETSIADASS